MMKGFLGQYDINIDDQGRVRIPAKYKAQLGDEFVIACGSTTCLSVYPMEKWEKLTEEVNKLSEFDEEALEFRRSIYTNATWGEFDSAGRVLIPVRYRDYAELTKELVVTGVGDHFEIWSAEKWNAGSYSSLSKRRELQKGISEKLSGGKNGI